VLAVAAPQEHTDAMRTLTRRLAPHARTAWLTFGAVSAVMVALAVAMVLLNGGGRTAVVATAGTWFVLVVVLGAFLDAILVPGNPDVRRQAGHAAGWTGAIGGGGGHGGHADGGGSCG
jgi:hypothetical protein